MIFNFDKTGDFNEEELAPSPNEAEEDEFSEGDVPADIPLVLDDADEAPELGDIVYDPEAEPQDEDEGEAEPEPPPPIEIAPFNPQEINNFAYTEASNAFYEERNYERAIEKFDEALKSEQQRRAAGEPKDSDIIAKSLYWKAEACVKTQDIPKALGILEDLIETCKGHYLTVAAQRRVEQLKAKHS